MQPAALGVGLGFRGVALRLGAGVGVAIGTRNGIGKGQRGVYSFLNVSPTVLNRTLAHTQTLTHTVRQVSSFKGVPKGVESN